MIREIRNEVIRLFFIFLFLGAIGYVGAKVDPMPAWNAPAIDWTACSNTFPDPIIDVVARNPSSDTILLAGYREVGLKTSCAVCNNRDTSKLDVHHIIPQRMWADPAWSNRPAFKMNDLTNLVTLCEDCHFVVGHLRNYRTGAVTNFWRVLEELKR